MCLPLRAPAFLALVIGAALSSAGHAQTAPTPDLLMGCPEWRTLNPADLRAARVTVSRAVFTDVTGKPGRAYVVKDDLLLQGPAVNGRRCSYFVKGGAPTGVGGYLNTMLMRNLPTSPALSGTWAAERAQLNVTKTAAGAWTVSGNATAPTAGGSVNTGELGGPVARQGDAWRYAVDGCTLSLWPVGPWLVAQDNGACGGLNVTFGGLYTRQR
ncbi:hypothetical protein [Deinococcus radiotolerans]|uniref:Uncharacterized protein n=1 Tax=Deinococcus radiotolerans TaxID=1309407 RepID=A0ABQ2FH95_9DEIO|nr:hypothetical protein [Deinococcus radiotolerans]GGK96330.1 hypothetical protein GCM10010844_13430 [Deinococcus radiotolerans]